MSLLLAAVAFAEEARPDFPKVKPNGLVYAHYGYDLSEGAESANEFDLDRAYLGLDAQISKKIGARVLLDASHDEVDPILHVFVKNAWVEGKDFVPGLTARFGVVDTSYATWHDRFGGHRYLFKNVAEEAKLVSTADAGVNLQGNHAGGLLAWHLGVFNGEGYKKIELDAGKMLSARLTVDPLARSETMDLPISVHVADDLQPEEAEKESTLMYAVHVGYKFQDYVLLTGEYFGTSAGAGEEAVAGAYVSGMLVAGVPKYASFVGRFDRRDPDGEVEDDATLALYAGVEHVFFDKVSATLLYEREWSEAEAEPEHGIFLRAQAGF